MLESYALYKSLNMWKRAQIVRRDIAYGFLSRQDASRAIQELLECAKEFERVEDHSEAAVSYARLARVLLRQNRAVDAGHFIEVASQLYPADREDRNLAYIMRIKAEFLLHTEQYRDCIELSSRSANLLNQMGLQRESAKPLQLIMQCYRQQGMLENALEMSNQIIELLGNTQYGNFQS